MTSTGTGAVAAEHLVGTVQQLTDEVRTLAHDAGRDDLAHALDEQERRGTDAAATVVLAGAQKRGKSRLLNALIGHPDLLPVDADIATHTHVAIGFGAGLAVTVTHGDPPRPDRIDPADLVHYASVLGEPERRRTVLGVDVTIDRPFLQGLRIVDTPGVDSLTLGHRHATTAALARADVLLFAVSSQDQPVLRHELEFLAEAAERVSAVAFAFTKVEDSASADTLLQENLRRLATFVQQQDLREPVASRLLRAPWFAVSAKLGEAAVALREAGRTERADQRRARSGLDALEHYLQGCAGRRRLLRGAALLGLDRAVLDQVRTLSDDAAAGSSDDAAALRARSAELDAEREQLDELVRVRRVQGVDHQFLGRSAASTTREKVALVRRAYEREIREIRTPKALDAYVGGLVESLRRSVEAVWEEISVEVERSSTETLVGYLDRMGVPAAELTVRAPAMPTLPGELSLAPTGSKRVDLIADGVPSMMMASSVTSIAVATTGVVGILVLPIAVVGGAVALAVLRQRKQIAAVQRDQVAVIGAVGDLLTAATADMCLEIERSVQSWRAQADGAVEDFLAQRRRELDGRRRELTELGKRDRAQKQRAAARAAEHLGRVTALADRAARLDAETARALLAP